MDVGDGRFPGLSDAVEGRQLWSLREDSALDDLFAVQDRIARRLFVEMQVSLTVGETTRTVAALAGDFETLVRVYTGRDAFQRFDVEGLHEAERIWTELRERNPDTPLGPYLLAWIPWQRVILRVSHDPAADNAEAKRLAREALAMQEFGDPYLIIALTDAAAGRYQAAVEAVERALQLSPGGADVNALGGVALYNSGEARRGLDLMLKGMRLEPDYPEWLPGSLYPALLEAGRFDEVISLANSVLAREMRDVNAHPLARVNLTAAYALKGDLANAREVAGRMLSRTRDLTADALLRWFCAWQASRPFHDEVYQAFLAAGVPRATNE